jgi:hypothetical protein
VLERSRRTTRGTTTGQTYDGNRVFDVVVKLHDEGRRDPESVSRLLLRNREGAQVSLGQLADVYLATGRQVILHDGARRYQEVSCNVEGRDQASFARLARETILGKIKFSGDSYPQFLGVAEQQSTAKQELTRHSLLAGAGIVLLLSLVFHRARNLLLVLANLPFALVGGVLAVHFSGGTLSVGSLVGFVTLFGITTRNSIMMVSHFEHLVAVEGRPWGLETALRGAPSAGADPDDGAGDGARAAADRDRRRGGGARDRGPMALVILGGWRRRRCSTCWCCRRSPCASADSNVRRQCLRGRIVPAGNFLVGPPLRRRFFELALSAEWGRRCGSPPKTALARELPFKVPDFPG